MAPVPKHKFRLQGYVDPEVYHVLFDNYFVAWGIQGKIIRSLLGKLAAHVSAHCNPHLPLYARLEELDELLSRVSFGQPRQARRDGDGQSAVAGAPGSDPAEASGSPPTASEPRPRPRQHPHAADAQEGPRDAKEGQATAPATAAAHH